MCSYVISMSLVWACMSSVCNSYIFVCDPYVTRMCSMSSVCHSYVLVCHPCVTRMGLYFIRMSLVGTRMSSLCHSYGLVCHPYVTRMCSCVIYMSLVCGFAMNLFQEFSVSIKKAFILAGGRGTRLSFYGV